MPNALLTFRTRQAKSAARKQGKIEGYFGKIAKGRPPSQKPPPLTIEATLPMNKPKSHFQRKTHKPVYVNWNMPENFPSLKEAVSLYLRRNEDHDDINGINPLADKTSIPRSTLQRHVKRFELIAAEHGVSVQDVTREMVFPKLRGGGKALLDDCEVELLASTMRCRDEANNGMSRNEAITLIMELSQTSCRRTAENHFDYLIRQGKMKGLKNNGRTVAAQATTTKRSQIQVEQQLRWHTCVDDALFELRRLNQPEAEFEDVQDHFFGNLDETCLMANSDGSIRVIASSNKKKTEKNTDDSRASITSLRVGMASGEQGPFTFLAKGTRMDRPSIKTLLNTRCPKGSAIVMSPSAYMTDDTWAQLVPAFCKGIRQMPVIKDYPNWWVCISLDGFGSHVNVEEAHKTFAEHKIKIIKEEGDSSQVNQAYDQVVAKQDKTHMRHHLELVRRKLGSRKIDQWTLISLAIEAQLKVTHQDWIRSHKRVNTHPSTDKTSIRCFHQGS